MTLNQLKTKFPNASQAFINANLSSGNSNQASIVECDSSLPPLEKKEVQGRTGQSFLVVVTSFRKRLIDEDNLCEKYFVDLCRYAGIIPDDSADKTKIEVKQNKCGKNESEKTLIEVFEIGN